MQKVKEVVDWPPEASGSYTGGSTFPRAEQAIIKDVRTVGNQIDVTCDGGDVHFPITAPDEKIAGRLEKILNNNIGKTLLPVGEAEIPED
jgi:hypothetical protein